MSTQGDGQSRDTLKAGDSKKEPVSDLLMGLGSHRGGRKWEGETHTSLRH